MRHSNLHIKNLSHIIFAFFFLFLISAGAGFAQSREVTAEKGDGIYRLLTKNGLSATEYMNAFIELNKNNLGKDNSLFEGKKYILPDSPVTAAPSTQAQSAAPAETSKSGKIEKHEIFGKKFADVEIRSDELKGAIYYLKSGHGGPDPGAVGRYDHHQICEDEYAYDVTLRIARNLIERGAKVYLITIDKNDGIRDEAYLKADKDEVCYPNQKIPLNQVKRLRQRVDAVNDLYKQNRNSFQRLIVIHVDSRSKGENIDVFFYHDERSETGKKAAETLLRTFRYKYNEHQPGRGYGGTVSSRNLYVVKNTFPPAVYIELGNVNHDRDIKRIIIPDNRQALANWLAQGLVTDFQNNK